MKLEAYHRPQLIVTGLMVVVGFYDFVRPGETLSVAFHFVDLGTNLLGYLVFSLFGSFAAYLGGPVVQVAFPLSLFVYLLSLRKPFFASLALFWAAHSLADVSLYVRDARAMTFLLYNGGEHIWHRLLQESGLLAFDKFMGNLLYLSGVLTLLTALGVALLGSRAAR